MMHRDAGEREPDREVPRYAEALEASNTSILVVSAALPDQPIIYVNPAFSELTGYSAEETIGRNCRFLQGAGTAPEAVQLLRGTVSRLQSGRVTLLNYRKDGTAFWNEVFLAPIRDASGRVVQWVGVQSDVTERQHREAELSRLAAVDGLTGLLNRRRFHVDVEAELARIRRYGGSVALVLLDLDGFKAVNDTYGHAGGDEVLRATSAVLAGEARESDRVGRLGGDEFALLLPESSAEAAVRVTARIRQRLSELSPVAVRVSAGVAVTSSPDVAGLSDLMAGADGELYAAKRAGR